MTVLFTSTEILVLKSGKLKSPKSCFSDKYKYYIDNNNYLFKKKTHQLTILTFYHTSSITNTRKAIYKNVIYTLQQHTNK